MNFKPGDRVWIDNAGGGYYPAGTYAAVLISVKESRGPGWWEADIDTIDPINGTYPLAHESNMRRRDDPPPQQEPKREAVGDWDLCPWRPVSVPKESA